MTTKVPWGYGTTLKTLDEIEDILRPNYHPEYIRRLLLWLEFKGGKIGIGSTFRPDGTQPDDPGFAPEGKSFHQNQKYSDGFVGACAVDLVAYNLPNIHRTVAWSEVAKQGSEEARTWGVHCNVDKGSYPEPWHMQPIEIDGWDSWNSGGRPCPKANYPTPDPTPEPQPPDPPDPVPGAPKAPNGLTAEQNMQDGGKAATPPSSPQITKNLVHNNSPWLQQVLCSMLTLPADGAQPIYPPLWVGEGRVGNEAAVFRKFGDGGAQALAYWQSKNGLTADGQYGPKTESKMRAVRGK